MVNITCRGGNVNADTVSFRGKIKKSFRRILDSAKALSFSQCNIRVNNRIELFLKNLRQGDTVYIQPEAEYHPSAMLQSIINAGMIPGHEFSGVVTETGRTGRGVGVFPADSLRGVPALPEEILCAVPSGGEADGPAGADHAPPASGGAGAGPPYHAG